MSYGRKPRLNKILAELNLLLQDQDQVQTQDQAQAQGLWMK